MNIFNIFKILIITRDQNLRTLLYLKFDFYQNYFKLLKFD